MLDRQLLAQMEHKLPLAMAMDHSEFLKEGKLYSFASNYAFRHIVSESYIGHISSCSIEK